MAFQLRPERNSSGSESDDDLNLLKLPDCVLEYIFEYLSYDEIAKLRIVSQKMNKICQGLLNRGFNKMVKRHSRDLKAIKSRLPRRESDRRTHSLSRHVDILTCIETRISMLSMTYSKYMEMNLCCFIPGKVIDEVFRVLRLLDTSDKPFRAHEVLQELRDLSSMAIEHFDENIAVILKKYITTVTRSSRQTSSASRRSALYSLYRKSSSSKDVANSSDLIREIPRFRIEINPPSTSGLSASSNAATGSDFLKFSPEELHEIIGNQNEDGRESPLFTPYMNSNCEGAQENRELIMKLKDKFNQAIKKFNNLVQINRKQAADLRQSVIIISDMKTQLDDLKKRVEETDAKSCEMSADIGQLSDDLNVTSPVKSPLKQETTPTKRRTATVILKRRITEPIRHADLPSISAYQPINRDIDHLLQSGLPKAVDIGIDLLEFPSPEKEIPDYEEVIKRAKLE